MLKKSTMPPLFTTLVFRVILGMFFFSVASTVSAFNQPNANFSATTFMDGGAPPGFYYIHYGAFINGEKPLDKDGNTIPGDAKVNVLADVHQFYYLTNMKVLGGNFAVDVIVPVVAVTAKGSFGGPPFTSNTAGMGDLTVGPAIQWDGGKLFGAPVFQRTEIEVTLPTGKYDKGTLANPGSNLLSVNTYYSVVWLFHPKWETSWRFYYTFHGENDDSPFGKVKPGHMVHINYAASMAIAPKWRVGGAGYLIRQLTEDKINGVKSQGSKERAMAFGPGVTYSSNGLSFILSHPIEFGVRNRFKGSRTTLQIVHKF